MARLAPPDPYAGVADPSQLARVLPDLDMVSSRIPEAAELQDLAQAVEAAALAVPGVTKSGGAGASAFDRTGAMAISNGFSRASRRTGGLLQCVRHRRRRHGDGARLRLLVRGALSSDLARPKTSAARPATARSGGSIRARSTSQTVPVVFDRRVAASLIGHLLGAINGSAIARSTSFLKDQLGQQIFRPAHHHHRRSAAPARTGSRPFDGEGLPCHARNLIEDGG